MSRRNAGVLAISILLACFAIVDRAYADIAACVYPQNVQVTGSFFHAYESAEYSSEGYLIVRLQNASTSARAFYLGSIYYDDNCQRIYRLPDSNTWMGYPGHPQIVIPAGVTRWSVRFTSANHFDVWDDQNGTILMSSGPPAVIPDYMSVSFVATESVLNGGSLLATRSYKIKENAEPPIVENTIDQASLPCPEGAGQNFFFDPSYQRAEYVDGLLRIHLLKYLEMNGSFYADVFPYDTDTDCADAFARARTTGAQTVPPSVLTPWIKYFSLRMTSATHWEFWNDETNTKIVCQHCEGDVPEGTPYVFLFAQSAGAHTLSTTMYPPTEPAPEYCTPGVDENCISNVMFLPGIEASRLFAPGQLTEENQIWEPDSPFGNDVPSLDMTTAEATNSVYVRKDTVLKVAYFVYRVYESFVEQMDALKTNGAIADWEPVAYDWRLDYEDLLNYGHEMSDGKIYYRGVNAATTTDPYIIQQLKHLADTSKTGKVTIIAHSNGGLLAKAMLSRPELTQYVDKVILVASPQLGTPQAVGGLLHGFNQALPEEKLPFFLSDANARYLGLNMPMAYNLLPTSSYFSHTQNPVITIDPLTLQDWVQKYGQLIDTQNELRLFMTDTARTDPEHNDILTPEIVSEAMYENAIGVHAELDSWSPPSGVELVTIAGWGVDTVDAIKYKKVPKYTCVIRSADGACASSGITHVLTYEPKFVVDGDGTVVESSAQWTNGVTAQRYWVDLGAINSATGNEYTHANILEAGSVRSLIESLLTEGAPSSPNISSTRPAYDGSNRRLYFILHSPLTLGFVDNSGAYTGSTASNPVFNVAGVDYERFGEVQWLSVPVGHSGRVVLQGTGSGSFALDIREVNGNDIVAASSFAAIPSSTSTRASLTVMPGTSAATNGALEIDFDGDGSVDRVLSTASGEIVIPEFYRFEGFMQPINDTAFNTSQSTSVFKVGSTIPVKFQIKNSAGIMVQASSTPLWLTPQKLGPLSSAANESATTTTSSTGNAFKWDEGSKQYVYNWSTKGFASGYWYKLSVKLDDGTVKSVTVGLK